MAYLGKDRREDLFVIATELNLEFDKSMTIATIKDLIIGSENYDEELTKNIHSTIVEDRKAREKKQEEQKEKLRIEEQKEKLRIEQLRFDEQKRKDEFELVKLRIQTQSKLGADTSKERNTKFLVNEVSKFIHHFDLKEDISLYLKLFERQAQRLNINQENWISGLLGLLPTEVSHIIVREPDDKANSYEHVKDSLLKRFKLTPEKFRQLFVAHQKAPQRTWIDFYPYQISAENLQEELYLRHVENRQIKKEFEKFIQDYKPEKTASTDVMMRIILKDEEPVCQPPRRLAFTERQEVNKQIEEWLNNKGIIHPSSSEYASPIVMVKKKDGSSRMCIDYRLLNQKLVKDKFPLPLIEDVLDTSQEEKVYSTLDLRNGFFHVDVDEDYRKYTSFIIPDGLGLSTSPGVFQHYVSSTRKGIVISYLDDLVIPAKNEQEE
ncbi:hypothetical protein TNCV_81081 [Trichonephila clavipes]|nr:hypothetical protein TNCV_81081 [Trichonephila clavipes]